MTAAGRVHLVCGLSALALLPFAALLINRDLARSLPPRLLFLTYAIWLLTAVRVTARSRAHARPASTRTVRHRGAVRLPEDGKAPAAD